MREQSLAVQCPRITSSVEMSDPIVNGRLLSSLRVVDLKQELEKRGISKSGSKKELVDRLRTVSPAPAPSRLLIPLSPVNSDWS